MDEITFDLEVNKDGNGSEDGWMVGFLTAEKPINRGATMVIPRNLWPELEAPLIGEISQNLFSITFSARISLSDALIEIPWSALGYCFTLNMWPDNLAVGKLYLSMTSYWMLCLDLGGLMSSRAKKVVYTFILKEVRSEKVLQLVEGSVLVSGTEEKENASVGRRRKKVCAANWDIEELIEVPISPFLTLSVGLGGCPITTTQGL
ncbi:hypothetical protein CCACVL1_17269 [Corchorus capsularis]|uniref:DUF4283 domain-containing protein n=1 Tax=Corchorus capsularis TaxID=210143 RepID=A0A1R3HSY6_COCAP|nr:hypothetical protein CCACVL1_17269 [Corchorus capsularis]